MNLVELYGSNRYLLISPETQVLLQNKAYRREAQSEYLVIPSNPHWFFW